MAFYCLSPRTIFENTDEEIRLCKNLEIDAVNLCVGVIVVGYETDPVDDRNGYAIQQSE
jgi:hypothetical protein